MRACLNQLIKLKRRIWAGEMIQQLKKHWCSCLQPSVVPVLGNPNPLLTCGPLNECVYTYIHMLHTNTHPNKLQQKLLWLRKERTFEAGLSRLGFKYRSGRYFQLVRLFCLSVCEFVFGQWKICKSILFLPCSFRGGTQVRLGSWCLPAEPSCLPHFLFLSHSCPLAGRYRKLQMKKQNSVFCLCAYQLCCAYA